MIALSIGKKGSGKTALVRKLASQVTAAKRAIFYHDPQAQISTAHTGRTYASPAEYVADPRPPYLAVFRECSVEQVGALALRVRDVTVCVDEMDRAFNGKQWLSPAIKQIVHEGRHFRVSLLGTFRRTANVSEDILSQTDYAFLFRTTPTSPYDLQAIAKRFGAAYADAVAQLKVGQFLIWSDDA